MEQLKKVVVMLSYYNGEKFIEEQVDSILGQKGVDIYLIIRDDGSSEFGKVAIEKYKNHNNIDVLDGENLGCTNSFFSLLEYAYKHYVNFDYFAFSDQDDYWLDEKLLKATAILENFSQEEMNLYCSNLIVTDSDLNKLGMMWPENVKVTLENSIVENHCAGCTMVFNKELVSFFFKNKPSEVKLHDKWLFHTCLLFGNVYYDDHSYILYRQHGNNVEGAGFTLKSKIINLLNSISQINQQHIKEKEAKELLMVYQSMITKEQGETIEAVAYYKKNLIRRLRLLCEYRGIKMNGFFDNIKLKLRVIIGSV